MTVSRTVYAIRPLACQKCLKLHNEVTNQIFVQADSGRLHQVLLNLLSNSVKFTGQGFVSVSVSSDGEWASVAVSDSGIGIAEVDLERVFDEFVQIGADHPNAQVGSGLGLPLARGLVQAMGGTIAAASRPGVGSTFRIRLRRS
jgi:signal transduction histidine kinase